jgi:hypothetical protein
MRYFSAILCDTQNQIFHLSFQELTFLLEHLSTFRSIFISEPISIVPFSLLRAMCNNGTHVADVTCYFIFRQRISLIRLNLGKHLAKEANSNFVDHEITRKSRRDQPLPHRECSTSAISASFDAPLKHPSAPALCV